MLLYSLFTAVLMILALDYMTGWIRVCDCMAIVGRKVFQFVLIFALFLPHLGNILTVFIIVYRLFAT